MVTLNDLSVGDSAIIVAVHGDDGIAVRFMEMGLIDGEPIELIGLAPLGDPMEFAVRGYRLSLRRDEAQRVEVQRG